jgi:predicted nucleic acid-binding protein
VYFVDSSALVKAYITEAGTQDVQTALAALGEAVCVSSQVIIETAAAIARLRRMKVIRPKVYARAHEDFLNHCNTRFHVVHPPEAVIGTTLRLIDTHRMRSPGGSDWLHLATAEYARILFPGETISFMCCDVALRTVAEERGFDVFDPLRDPLSVLLPPTAPSKN